MRITSTSRHTKYRTVKGGEVGEFAGLSCHYVFPLRNGSGLLRRMEEGKEATAAAGKKLQNGIRRFCSETSPLLSPWLSCKAKRTRLE